MISWSVMISMLVGLAQFVRATQSVVCNNILAISLSNVGTGKS